MRPAYMQLRDCQQGALLYRVELQRNHNIYDVHVQVEVGQGGLAPLVVGMLPRAPALTTLQLLQVTRVLYEHARSPKQFVLQYGLPDALCALVPEEDARSGNGNLRPHAAARRASGAGGNQSVLVRKQALALLQALRMHTAV